MDPAITLLQLRSATHVRSLQLCFQLAGMQMDNVRVHIGLHALHSFPVLPEVLHDDPRRIVGRTGRRAALVRQVHLLDRRGGGLLQRLGHRRGRACHEVLRPVFHVLSNGAGVGQSHIVGRWVDGRPETRVGDLYFRGLNAEREEERADIARHFCPFAFGTGGISHCGMLIFHDAPRGHVAT